MKGTVGELGEFGLIRELTSRLTTTPAVRVGPGDDAAVVAAPDRRVVASTDILVEGRHFRRDWSTAYDVGRKAAAQNLADIAAMGSAHRAAARPGRARRTPGDLGGRADGRAARRVPGGGRGRGGGGVVGGDTITVAIDALGDLRNKEPVTRAGARPGDVVAVTGWLGWSAAGYAVLSRGFRSPRAFVEAHRRPEPPYHAGPAAAGLGATAMCDVSDGLVADLGRIAEASKVLARAPASPTPPQMSDIGQAVASTPPVGVDRGRGYGSWRPSPDAIPGARWKVIGEVLNPSALPQVTVDGAPWTSKGGWDHFGAFADTGGGLAARTRTVLGCR
ncbi:Thiamine-monophosphate kinase OS=Streptomyces microflavus OX=1919 GN=thiL PE=3 SV=1 [Streptomyces microflavus]